MMVMGQRRPGEGGGKESGGDAEGEPRLPPAQGVWKSAKPSVGHEGITLW